MASLLSCNTFSDVQTMPRKPLQCQILGSAPRLYTDAAYSCKVGYNKGIYAIVFIKGIEGFLVLGNFFRIETVDLCPEWRQLVAGRKIISDMDAVESGGLQPDDDMIEFMAG